MIHEIINPSDAYTIETDDMALLTASIFALGEGMYATRSDDTDYEVPMTAFGGDNAIEFFKKEFDFDFADYVGGNKVKIGECLSTVCLGDADDRLLYFSALDKIEDEAKKEEFVKEWYDKKQSSMNGIGQRAMALSKALKGSTNE